MKEPITNDQIKDFILKHALNNYAPFVISKLHEYMSSIDALDSKYLNISSIIKERVEEDTYQYEKDLSICAYVLKLVDKDHERLEKYNDWLKSEKKPIMINQCDIDLLKYHSELEQRITALEKQIKDRK